MPKHKQTKIVATIGPVTETEEILEQLVVAGMNVARFNTKHSDPAWHNERIQRVRNVSDKLNKSVGILLDLQGPEIRINLPGEKAFEVKKGDSVIFTSDPKHDAKNYIIVPQTVIESMSQNDQVLLEDGACEFFIQEIAGTYFTAQAIVDCKIQHRKTMNTPGVILEMPSLTDRDYLYLDGVKPDLIDFVGLSFVRDANDVHILREELDKRGIKAGIVSKIENQAALDNIDKIIAVSDAIMIARGDLGVEVPFEELTYWQKELIIKCRNAAKPVITATQMLKSMVDSPRPTRAEVSDVANAIYDGTDAIMLSDETTIGNYPVKCVATQATIASFNETHAYLNESRVNTLEETTSESAISHAAQGILNDANFKIDKIVCLTETGKTARLLARFRGLTPINAITSNDQTKRNLSLVFGVEAYKIDMGEKRIENADTIIKECLNQGIITKGETVMFVHGTFWKHPGLTNTLSVITI
jgi:pyruvate kinase